MEASAGYEVSSLTGTTATTFQKQRPQHWLWEEWRKKYRREMGHAGTAVHRSTSVMQLSAEPLI